ncbi:hypothetical protein CAC42_98 [Sphaceloma murrayae]|uniref:DUF1754-domain-containing protein n=1 Tax=Sphaceloma murrayae TaxID=2082308 RepID=A0A2K1QN93_9PEZI|nr:hypothetical protein CAC42_98 [Sphaceloma murrayae]
MPSSDYTSAVGGGLKLKGAKDAGIDKKKKKKKRTADATHDKETPTNESLESEKAQQSRVVSKSTDKSPVSRDQDTEKTEAERKYEEVRRKRLEERLRRDGIRTHKEKVEELNKYLSGLSEHHDMPRIGPG